MSNVFPKSLPYCITLVCNFGFLDYALFVAHQLLQQKYRNYDIVICSADDCYKQLYNIENISFLQVDTEAFTGNLPVLERLGKYAYWRIPAIEKLAHQYDKILYLDTDIFVNSLNINVLFDIELKDYPIAAVRDVHQITKPKRLPRECKVLNKSWFPYFNSGVLLVNSKQWLSQNCFEKIRLLCDSSAESLVRHDQSLLNLMCDGKWLELSPVWNWQYSYKNCFLTEYVSPKFIHIAGEKKIWHQADGSIPRRYWEAYQNYANNTVDEAKFPNWGNSQQSDFSRRLIKNIFYFKAYKKYLAQFPNITSTIQHK